MRIGARFAVGMALVIVIIGGAWISGVKWFLFSEERINEAFPLSTEARIALDAVEQLPAADTDVGLRSEVQRRLRIRAQMCAKGYRPSWWESSEDIRSNIPEPGCFTDQDAALTRWLAWLRIGFITSLPPLYPMPSDLPKTITLSSFATDIQFSENAGLLLAASHQNFEIRELVDGDLVWKNDWKMRNNASASSAISPNGRIVALWDGAGTVLWEIVSRTELARIPDTRPKTFRWLDDRTISYTESSRSSPLFIDLVHGNSASLDYQLGDPRIIFAAKDRESEYVILTSKALSRVALQRGWQRSGLNVTAERHFDSALPFGSAGEIATHLGDAEVVSGGIRPWKLSLDSLHLDVADFRPLSISDAVATPEPDAMVIRVSLPEGHEKRHQLLAYSWSNNTVRPIVSELPNYGRVRFSNAINRNIFLYQKRLMFVGSWRTGPAMSLEAYLAIILSEAAEGRAKQISGYLPGSASGGLQTMEPSSVLAALAQKSRVESIGVYEAEPTSERGRKHQQHPIGDINVRVRASKSPTFLVLSSYEPVRWNLHLSKGVKLSAILLFGNPRSEVIGNGSTQVLRPSSTYAYKRRSAEYQRLDSEVRNTIGKGIEIFQGQYKGRMFDVGGN